MLRLEDVLARVDRSLNERAPGPEGAVESRFTPRDTGASAREPLLPAGEEGIVEGPRRPTLAKLAAAPKNTELLLRLAHHRTVEAANIEVRRGRETWANVTSEYRLLSLRDILERFGSPNHVGAQQGGANYLQVDYYYRVGKRHHGLKFLLHDRLVVYAGAR